jgi:predicted transcriptional regulator
VLKTEEYGLFTLDASPLLKRGFSLRRSHLEIRMDILSCVKAGIEKPTQIMYKANLSWTALQEHLTALEEGDLIQTTEYGNRRRYALTEKALAVLMTYQKVLEEVSSAVKGAPKL